MKKKPIYHNSKPKNRKVKKLNVKKNSGSGRVSYLKYIFFAVLVIAAIIIFFMLTSDNKKTSESGSPKEPKFVKEGELDFIRGETDSLIKRIDIEIADSPDSRVLGLMYRNHMDEDKGMLFIFPVAELQSFWMKNTYISLDIIFVSEKNIILNIHKNTIPRSEKAYVSTEDAKYVVEVVSGFTDKFSVKPGDKIRFLRSDNK